MKWTSEKPNKPGWWWFRRVDTSCDKPKWWGASIVWLVQCRGLLGESYDGSFEPIDEMIGQIEWSSGPIPEPDS